MSAIILLAETKWHGTDDGFRSTTSNSLNQST